MNNPIRVLQAAIITGAAAVCVLYFQLQHDFDFISARDARIFGIAFSLVVILLVFWIGNWTSSRAKIYGGLILALILELIPIGLYSSPDFAAKYYVDASGMVVLSRFPGDVFDGKAKMKVNSDVLAAWEWQQGKRTDPAGRPLLFYRIKPDGTVLVFDSPVDLGQVLRPLDSATLEVFNKQQIARAEKFRDEGDSQKAKEILAKITNLEPNNDEAYRLTQRILRDEETKRREAEEAERARLEAEALQKQALEDQRSVENEKTTNGEDASTNTTKTSRRHHRPNYNATCNSNYYSQSTGQSSYYQRSYMPTVSNQPQYYVAPRTNVIQQAPRQVQQRPSTYTEINQYPSNPTPRVVVVQPLRPSNVVVYRSSSTNISNVSVPVEKKKGMSWKKKFLIGAGVAGAVVLGEELVRRHR